MNTAVATKTKITVARGDGIGPEIMEATLDIINAAGAKIETEEVEIGEKVYNQGLTAGITPETWDSLRRTKVFLKAPITTPQGGGFKSLNVTVRKTLGMYANVRPCVSYHPFVSTKHPVMDIVVIRENEEDLYAGIEHQQTPEVTQCLKLITRPGSEKIIRYAFEYAKKYNRKKVTCFSKDNIMKLTDGLFHKVFDEIKVEYPEIETDHWIVDIGAAKIADTPEEFDVVVMPNLYGDILSDIAAQITGSIGLGGSANISPTISMFEAIHGSAPMIAGQGIANPSGLILGAVMMLVHIGQGDVATKVHNAWLKTIEDGIHTGDIFNETTSKVKANTKEFAQAVIDRLGQEPNELTKVFYDKSEPIEVQTTKPEPTTRKLVGTDVFLYCDDRDAQKLGDSLKQCDNEDIELLMISNRGLTVYPNGHPETFCTDHWRCRFMSKDQKTEISFEAVIALLDRVNKAGFDVIKTEGLYHFNDKPVFSLGQGQ